MIDAAVNEVVNRLTGFSSYEIDIEEDINVFLTKKLNQYNNAALKGSRLEIIANLILYLSQHTKISIVYTYSYSARNSIELSFYLDHLGIDLNELYKTNSDDVTLKAVGSTLNINFDSVILNKRFKSLVTAIATKNDISCDNSESLVTVNSGVDAAFFCDESVDDVSDFFEANIKVAGFYYFISASGPIVICKKPKTAIPDLIREALYLFEDNLYLNKDKLKINHVSTVRDVNKIVNSLRKINVCANASVKLTRSLTFYKFVFEKVRYYRGKLKLIDVKSYDSDEITVETIYNAGLIRCVKKPSCSGIKKTAKTSILNDSELHTVLVMDADFDFVYGSLPDFIKVRSYEPTSVSVKNKNSNLDVVVLYGSSNENNDVFTVLEEAKINEVLDNHKSSTFYYIKYSRLTKLINDTYSVDTYKWFFQACVKLKPENIKVIGVTEAGKNLCESLNIRNLETYVSDALNSLSKIDKEVVRFMKESGRHFKSTVKCMSHSKFRLFELFKLVSNSKYKKLVQDSSVFYSLLSKYKILIANTELYATEDSDFNFDLAYYSAKPDDFNFYATLNTNILELLTNLGPHSTFNLDNYSTAATLCSTLVKADLVNNSTALVAVDNVLNNIERDPSKLRKVSELDYYSFKFFRFVVDANNLEANLDAAVESLGESNLRKISFKFINLPLYLLSFHADKLSDNHLEALLNSANNLDLLFIHGHTQMPEAIEIYERRQFDTVVGGI